MGRFIFYFCVVFIFYGCKPQSDTSQSAPNWQINSDSNKFMGEELGKVVSDNGELYYDEDKGCFLKTHRGAIADCAMKTKIVLSIRISCEKSYDHPSIDGYKCGDVIHSTDIKNYKKLCNKSRFEDGYYLNKNNSFFWVSKKENTIEALVLTNKNENLRDEGEDGYFEMKCEPPLLKAQGSCLSYRGNALEIALALGDATKPNYQFFINEGGLNNRKNDTWCGYHVNEVNVNHNKISGFLEGFTIFIPNSESLYTNNVGRLEMTKLPSPNNLRRDIGNECTYDILKEHYSSTETENYACSVGNYGSYITVRIFLAEKKLKLIQCYFNANDDVFSKYDGKEEFSSACEKNEI